MRRCGRGAAALGTYQSAPRALAAKRLNGAACPAALEVPVHEVRAADLGFAEPSVPDVTLALQVLDQRMVWIVALGGTLQRFSHVGEQGRELRANDALPPTRIRHDRIPDLVQGRVVGHVDTATRKRLAGLDVQVETRGRRFPALVMTEGHADIGLVRALVGREADVAVDSEQRATHRTWVGDKVGTDLLQPRPGVTDEPQRRVADVGLVACLVFQEPVAVVVLLQLTQEVEQRRGKIDLLCAQFASPRGRWDRQTEYENRRSGQLNLFTRPPGRRRPARGQQAPGYVAGSADLIRKTAPTAADGRTSASDGVELLRDLTTCGVVVEL